MGKNTQPGVKLCRPSPLGFWSISTRSVVGDRYQTPPHRGEITTGESPARRASWRRTTSGPHHGVCAREDRYIQCPRSPRDDQTPGHRDGPHQELRVGDSSAEWDLSQSFEFYLARFLYGPRFFGSSVASSETTISSISPVSRLCSSLDLLTDAEAPRLPAEA